MTESHDDFDEDTIFDGTPKETLPLVPPREVNVLTSKPWVPFKIGNMRDGSNDYKEWPSKYFD